VKYRRQGGPPCFFHHPDWSEQDPERWWGTLFTGIPELLEDFGPGGVKGIGASGQTAKEVDAPLDRLDEDILDMLVDAGGNPGGLCCLLELEAEHE